MNTTSNQIDWNQIEKLLLSGIADVGEDNLLEFVRNPGLRSNRKLLPVAKAFDHVKQRFATEREEFGQDRFDKLVMVKITELAASIFFHANA